MFLLFLTLILTYEGPITPNFIQHNDFYKPSTLRIDGKGQFYITDSGANTVWVFSPTGTYLRQLGSEGQGPGEVNRPSDVAFLPNGEVVVGDGGNRRLLFFSATGEFLRLVLIADQPVGQLLVLPDGNIAMSRAYGLSFSLSFGGPTPKRFGVFSPEGKLLRSFGTYVEDPNPLLALMMNQGPTVVLGDQLIQAGMCQNDLVAFHGDKETHHKYPILFEPVKATASQKETKGSGGNSSVDLSVKVDMVCTGLAALGPNRLLLMRKVSAEEGAASQLIQIDLEGKLLKVYPEQFQGYELAVSNDLAYAFFITETDSDYVINRFKL